MRASSSTRSAQTADGDLKAEYWGDGRSFATSLSYTNATSYLTIFGGWHNKFHVLARINEHGGDRKEITDRPELRRRPREARRGRAGLPLQGRAQRRQERQVVGRRQRDAHVRGQRAARRAGARSLRLQRLGREGLLRQRARSCRCLERARAVDAAEIEKTDRRPRDRGRPAALALRAVLHGHREARAHRAAQGRRPADLRAAQGADPQHGAAVPLPDASCSGTTRSRRTGSASAARSRTARTSGT